MFSIGLGGGRVGSGLLSGVGCADGVGIGLVEACSRMMIVVAGVLLCAVGDGIGEGVGEGEIDGESCGCGVGIGAEAEEFLCACSCLY